MEPLNNSRITPEANRSMWAGIAALVTAIIPFVASNLLLRKFGVPIYVVMVIIPLIAVVLGGAAIIQAVKSLRAIRARKSYENESVEVLSGKGRHIFGLITGVIVSILGLIIIYVFSIMVKTPYQKFGTDITPPVGDAKLYYFKDELHYAIVQRSILLSDSTLITTGMQNTNDSARTRSGILLKTDLSGNELWLKQTPGGLSRIALLSDSTFINCRLEYPQPASKQKQDKLVIDLYDMDGNPIDTLTFNVGDGASIGTNATRSISPSGVAIAGVFHKSEDGNSGESYLFRADDKFSNQSFTKFPLNKTGEPIALGSNSKGEIYILGQKVNSIDARKAIRKRTPVLSKVSSTSELLWSKTYPTIQSPLLVDIMISKSHNIYILTNEQSEIYNHGVLMKLDSVGEIVWSKRVSGGDQNLVTAFAKRPGGWILTGSTRKFVLRTTISQRRDYWWNTYYICLLDSTGEIEHEFNGGLAQFSAWSITEISENYWAMTGTGIVGEVKPTQKVKRPDNDIGLLHYTFKPEDDWEKMDREN